MESGDESEKCRICLSTIKNRSVILPCFHEYCYDCILQWSRRRNCCPLCNARFSALRYNFKCEYEYEVRHIPFADITKRGGGNRRTRTGGISRSTRRSSNTIVTRGGRWHVHVPMVWSDSNPNARVYLRLAMQEVIKKMSSGTASAIIFEDPTPMIMENISRFHRDTATMASASRAAAVPSTSVSRIPSIIVIPSNASTLGETSLRSNSSVESVSSRSSLH